MMSLTFGLFTQVSGSGPLGPLVIPIEYPGHIAFYERVVSLPQPLSDEALLLFSLSLPPTSKESPLQ